MKPNKFWSNPLPGRWVFCNDKHAVVVSYREICFDGNPWRIEPLDSSREVIEHAMRVPALARALHTGYKTLFRAQMASELLVNSL